MIASAAAPIFEECYDIWMDFPSAMIEHCDREANQVAHELAQQPFASRDFCIWIDSSYSFIFFYFINDVTMLSDE